MTHPENSIYKLHASGRISINPFDHEPIKDIYYPLHLDGTLYAYKKDLAFPWMPVVDRLKTYYPKSDWYENKLDMFKDFFKTLTTICDFNSKIDNLERHEIKIPISGLRLRPNVLYFGKTRERIGLSNVSAIIKTGIGTADVLRIYAREDKIPVGFGWDYDLDCATHSPDSRINVCFQAFDNTTIHTYTPICLLKIINEKPKTDCNTEKPTRIWRLDDQHSR